MSVAFWTVLIPNPLLFSFIVSLYACYLRFLLPWHGVGYWDVVWNWHWLTWDLLFLFVPFPLSSSSCFVCCCLWVVCFCESVLLCSPDWHRTHYVAQASDIHPSFCLCLLSAGITHTQYLTNLNKGSWPLFLGSLIIRFQSPPKSFPPALEGCVARSSMLEATSSELWRKEWTKRPTVSPESPRPYWLA